MVHHRGVTFDFGVWFWNVRVLLCEIISVPGVPRPLSCPVITFSVHVVSSGGSPPLLEVIDRFGYAIRRSRAGALITRARTRRSHRVGNNPSSFVPSAARTYFPGASHLSILLPYNCAQPPPPRFPLLVISTPVACSARILLCPSPAFLNRSSAPLQKGETTPSPPFARGSRYSTTSSNGLFAISDLHRFTFSDLPEEPNDRVQAESYHQFSLCQCHTTRNCNDRLTFPLNFEPSIDYFGRPVLFILGN